MISTVLMDPVMRSMAARYTAFSSVMSDLMLPKASGFALMTSTALEGSSM